MRIISACRSQGAFPAGRLGIAGIRWQGGHPIGWIRSQMPRHCLYTCNGLCCVNKLDYGHIHHKKLARVFICFGSAALIPLTSKLWHFPDCLSVPFSFPSVTAAGAGELYPENVNIPVLSRSSSPPILS